MLSPDQFPDTTLYEPSRVTKWYTWLQQKLETMSEQEIDLISEEDSETLTKYWWAAWAGSTFVGGIIGMLVFTFEWSAFQKFMGGAILGATFIVCVFANRLIGV
jgi:hypothetical protein